MRHLVIVGHHQDRSPVVPVNLLQQLKNVFRILAVQIPGGLISQNALRLMQERPRDANPLPLSCRKDLHRHIRLAVHKQILKIFLGFFDDRRRDNQLMQKRKEHIL